MPRSLVLLVLCGLAPFAVAADPVEKQLVIQKAMSTAQLYLHSNSPAEAVAVLEADLPSADGSKAYLNLLRDAYLAELGQLMKEPNENAARITKIRRNLDLLVSGKAPGVPQVGSTASAPPVSVTPASAAPAPVWNAAPGSVPNSDPAAASDAAATAFKKADYVQAERLFAGLGAARLTQEQKAAWAYCRIRVAAEKVNSPQCDTATAAAAEKDVQEAIKLIPQHTELQKIGQQVLAAASLKVTHRDENSGPGAVAVPLTDSGDLAETPSFRVRVPGNKALAETIAKNAEKLRKETFERWSGPPAGGWEPKCEIVVHATAEAYARATNRPAASTGGAQVRLTNGRATERKIDLRADDASLLTNALPRELTHVVLADLFPDNPPPKWAEEGMAIMAGSSEESSRYFQTLRRCARDGEWFAVGQLMDLKSFPGEKITGFYCESVSLTQYLVRLRGERNFTIFLRDCERYGTSSALRRQYGIESPQALEAAWKRSAVEVSRGQAP